MGLLRSGMVLATFIINDGITSVHSSEMYVSPSCTLSLFSLFFWLGETRKLCIPDIGNLS